MRFSTFAFLAVGVLSISCTQPAAKVVFDDSTQIKLERTACFGTCPTYTVMINGNGEVTLVGNKFISKGQPAPPLPTLTRKLDKAQIDQLAAEFDRVGFLSLKDNYTDGSPDCPTPVTDNPSAITTLTTGGNTKTVRHYLGCGSTETLTKLTALEKKIDEITGTADWLK